MNRYDYMRNLADIEAVPQSMRAIQGYKKPVQAFTASEADRQLSDQRAANESLARSSALNVGKQRVQLGRSGLALRQKEFDRDLAFSNKINRIRESEYRKGLPLEIGSLGLEAYRGWTNFLETKERDEHNKLMKEREKTIIDAQDAFFKERLQLLQAGQNARTPAYNSNPYPSGF